MLPTEAEKNLLQTLQRIKLTDDFKDDVGGGKSTLIKACLNIPATRVFHQSFYANIKISLHSQNEPKAPNQSINKRFLIRSLKNSFFAPECFPPNK